VQLGVPDDCRDLLLEAIFTNTGGDVRMDNLREAVLEVQGTPTESALLGLGLRMGASLEVRVLYCTALYSTVLYCTVLYCTVL